MYVLAETDAFTTGSGLLSECLTDGRVVTVPLQGKTSVHLGWIHLRNTRISPLTERFVHLLEEALADSIAFTAVFRSRREGGCGKKKRTWPGPHVPAALVRREKKGRASRRTPGLL